VKHKPLPHIVVIRNLQQRSQQRIRRTCASRTCGQANGASQKPAAMEPQSQPQWSHKASRNGAIIRIQGGGEPRGQLFLTKNKLNHVVAPLRVHLWLHCGWLCGSIAAGFVAPLRLACGSIAAGPWQAACNISVNSVAGSIVGIGLRAPFVFKGASYFQIRACELWARKRVEFSVLWLSLLSNKVMYTIRPHGHYHNIVFLCV
jgi:hypothetical protein